MYIQVHPVTEKLPKYTTGINDAFQGEGQDSGQGREVYFTYNYLNSALYPCTIKTGT